MEKKYYKNERKFATKSIRTFSMQIYRRFHARNEREQIMRLHQQLRQDNPNQNDIE